MRGDGDLMERLAAADPLPGAEQLSGPQQQEADVLLERILATPVGATRRPVLRRGLVAAAAAAAAAVVAQAGVLDLVDDDGRVPGPAVVDRAIAAVTQQDGVWHVLERTRMKGARIPGGEDTDLLESWHATDGRIHRKTFDSDGGRRGRLLEEYAGRRSPGKRGGPLLRYEPERGIISESGFHLASGATPAIDPFAAPGAQLKALHDRGRLREAGTTEVGGRRAFRLVSDPFSVTGFPKEKQRIEFFVDADTYLPLARRQRMPQLEFLTEYVVYEQLPLTPRTRAQLRLDPHPGARCSPLADELGGEEELGFPNPCATTGRR